MKTKPRIHAYASAVRMLIRGATNHDIAEKTGMQYETVCAFTVQLKAAGAVRIADWEHTNPARRVYKIGAGPDAPRPNCERTRIRKIKEQARAERKQKAQAAQ